MCASNTLLHPRRDIFFLIRRFCFPRATEKPLRHIPSSHPWLVHRYARCNRNKKEKTSLLLSFRSLRKRIPRESHGSPVSWCNIYRYTIRAEITFSKTHNVRACTACVYVRECVSVCFTETHHRCSAASFSRYSFARSWRRADERRFAFAVVVPACSADRPDRSWILACHVVLSGLLIVTSR